MKNIKKDFGEKTVLRDINCSVGKGEIFGLLGPSGAGKTTIIKILTGQIVKTSGEAKLFDANTDKLTDEIYSQIGMVLDIQGLYTRLTCYDNLAVFAEIYNINKNRVYEVLEKVKLADEAEKTVSKLSKGMTQRLVIARSILHQPKIVFFDEPTSGLDPATSLEIHKMIFELREKGTTIFLTTHNMEEASVLCDNVALLNEGLIVEYGRPDAICRKYNNINGIKILLKDGEKVTLPNNNDSSEQIAKYFMENNIEAIHSTEPNLETVFISLTGRELV
jgi:ABC-2 type transport system ATP-binding protein